MEEQEKKQGEKKPEQEAKKDVGEEKKKEEPKDSPPAADAAPPPPQEIILKVYMHCEGCARKVRRCLKGFEGVEEVLTDCRASKVVVKGDKADPLKVFERVQRKSHRQVELISPIPKPPPPEEPKKVEEKEAAKPEEKKVEPPVLTVVLKVNMHCEACAQEIKKRIQKIKGVETAEPDLESSKVTVKGVVQPPLLVDFIYKRTGKQAVIVKVEQEKKEDDKAKEAKEGEKDAKKAEDGGKEGEKDAKKAEDDGKEGKESGGAGGAGADASGGGDVQPEGAKQDKAAGEGEGGDSKLDLKKNEFYPYYTNYPQNHFQHYQQGFVQHEFYGYQQYPPVHHEFYGYQQYPPVHHEFYGHQQYPPQMFSDENPNACSVM